MFDKIKSWFDSPSPSSIIPVSKQEASPFDKNRWLRVQIELQCSYNKVDKLKKALKPYAEKLGWVVSSDMDIVKNVLKDSDKNDITKEMMPSKDLPVSIFIIPHKNIAVFLTMDEFLQKKDKIMDCAYDIYKEIVCKDDNKRVSQVYIKKDLYIKKIDLNYFTEGSKVSKKDWIVNERLGVLYVSYPFVKRVNLEKKDKDKSVEVFGGLIKEDFKILETNKEIKKEINDLFGLDI